MNHEAHTVTSIRNVKAGEYFRKLNKDGTMQNTTWVRNHYDKASKSFSASDFYDMNREVFVKATALVAVGFSF